VLSQGDELELEPADFRTVKLAGASELFHTSLLIERNFTAVEWISSASISSFIEA
jgi:hypothetical protein